MTKASLMLISALILLSGCPQDNTKVENADTSANTQSTPVSSEPTPAATPKNEFQIGDTVQSGDWQITLHGIRTAKTINETGNEYQVATAGDGETFIIADLTVTNSGSEQKNFSSMLATPKISDADGYTYDMDHMAHLSLKKGIGEGAVQPGGKLRGEMPFKVSSSASGLQLSMSPDIGVKSAFFKLDTPKAPEKK